jgi:hypothetical protein
LARKIFITKGGFVNLDAFPVWESGLPTRLGINRDELRELRRQLTEGVDWVLKKKRVRFSEEGVNRLRGLLNLPLAPAPVALQEAGSATAAEGVNLEKSAPGGNAEHPDALKAVVTLHVWQTVKNARILEAFV